METTTMIMIGAGVLVLFLFWKFVLNRPSQLKIENEKRIKELREKKKDLYRETRPLPKDKKKN